MVLKRTWSIHLVWLTIISRPLIIFSTRDCSILNECLMRIRLSLRNSKITTSLLWTPSDQETMTLIIRVLLSRTFFSTRIQKSKIWAKSEYSSSSSSRVTWTRPIVPPSYQTSHWTPRAQISSQSPPCTATREAARPLTSTPRLIPRGHCYWRTKRRSCISRSRSRGRVKIILRRSQCPCPQKMLCQAH